MAIIEMGSSQRPHLQHRLGPGLQIQTQAQSLHNPNPRPNSKLGLTKIKHKLGPALAQAQQDFILFLVSSSAPGFSTIATSSRRQRRRHHVGKNAREWQPTPVLFSSRPRTPAPSQSRLRKAREPRSSGGPGS